MITRRHFRPQYGPAHPSMPPPLHVRSPWCDWAQAPRPLQAGGQPGPSLVMGGAAYENFGIDPTDPSTWGSRGYSQSAGMIGLPDLNRLPRPMNPQMLSAVPKGSVNR